MHKLTNEELSEAILAAINVDEILEYGGNKYKIVKKLNEYYQYYPRAFSTTNKGDYTLLRKVVESYIYSLKFGFED